MTWIAHETWFVDEPPTDWSFAFEAATLALLALAVIVTLAVRLVATRFPGVDIPFIGQMAPYMPFAARIHLAVSLIGLLSLGYYLSPSMDLEANVAGFVLGAVMVVVAITMASGWHAREGALLLVAAGIIGMIEFNVSAVVPARRHAGPRAVRAGRRPGPLVGRLRAPARGRPVAGVIEVLFGLLLISGALPQAIVVIAGIPFNTTLYFFGNMELVGHLPVYATVLILLVYGSNPRLRPATSAFRPLHHRALS